MADAEQTPESLTQPPSETEIQKDEPEGWEHELDVYPIVDPSEDPGWAIKTVKVWLYICIFSLVFSLALVILGIWYD